MLPHSDSPDSEIPILERLPFSPPKRPGLLGAMGILDILGHIGSGGMGHVFEAIHRVSKDRLAVKILRPELCTLPEARKAFLNEIRYLERLNHPAIIKVITSNKGDHPWFATELCTNGSLGSRLGSMSDSEILSVFSDTVQALLHAYTKQSILHRDIKPQNILLAADGSVRVTDFGTAQRLSSDTLHEFAISQRIGTLPYMSPQLTAGEADHLCDIYALGATLHEMLHGNPPSREGSLSGVSLHGNSKIRKHLHFVSIKCMHSDPTKRYTHLKLLAKDLNRISLGKSPIRPMDSLQWNVVKVIVSVVFVLLARWVGTNSATMDKFDLDWSDHQISYPGIHNWNPSKVDLSNVLDPHVVTLNDSRTEFLVFNSMGQILTQKSLIEDGISGTNVNITGLIDVGGDSEREIVIDWFDLDADAVKFGVYNQRGILLKIMGLDFGNDMVDVVDVYGPQIRFKRFLDLESDGTLEVLATLNTGYGHRSRGLYAFNYVNGQLLWKFATKGWAYEVATLGHPHSRDYDVLIATASVCNFDDDRVARLHCLSHKGLLKWSLVLGDEYAYPSFLRSEVRPSDLILLIVRSAPEPRESIQKSAFSSILQISKEGTVVARIDYNFYIESFTQFGNNFIIADHKGFFHILDANLKILDKKLPAGIPDSNERLVSEFIGQDDFNMDGKLEFLVDVQHRGKNKLISRREVLVLDAMLQPILKKRLPLPVDSLPSYRLALMDQNGDGVNDIAILEDSVKFLNPVSK